MLNAMTEQPRFDERFEALLEKGRAEHQAERLDEARATFAEAERLAEELGDHRAADRAYVNRCTAALRIESGLEAASVHRLREILMAGEDSVTCFLAAYDLARNHEWTKEHRKGLFYARLALDRARLLEGSEWVAPSLNQVGNFLLAESRFQEACENYEQALTLFPAAPSQPKAMILTNLGYARVTLGRLDGVSLIYESLRMLRSLGARRDQIFPHLDLCFALLELGAYRHALTHGAAALALAEEIGDEHSTKNALFLLGDAAQLAGDEGGAREHFRRLQERCFSDSPQLTELLLTVDVRKLINLRA